jgi:cytoskeleton protein RodZ
MTTPPHEPAAAEVGRTLREARLARGEELAAAAEELRVRPAYLEALEEGRLGRLLAPVYVVGQTRAYARHLGLDGAELGRRLKVSGDHGGAPDAERREPAAGRWRAAASLVGLLLLGAVAYAGYRAGFRTGPGTTPAPSTVTAAADPGGTAAPPSNAPREAAPSPASPMAAGTQPEPQRAAVAGPSPPPAESMPAPNPSAAEAATVPAPVQAADAPAPVQAADAPSLPAALTARDDAAPTGEVSPAAETGGPVPPAPPPSPADTTTAGPADAAVVASTAPSAPEAAAPQAEAAGPTPPPGRFAIQVASLRDPAGAAGEWQRLVKLHPTLAGLELRPAKVAEIPGKGRFYRVLGGDFATRAEAQAACARLLAEGSYCRPVPL